MSEDAAEEQFALVWPHCLLAEAGSPPVAALATLNDALWMGLIDEAMRHDVAVYLYHPLRRLDVSIPNQAQARLRALARQAAVASLRRTHELHQILVALHDSGITPTLLKGAALAHTLYPTPASRAMVDFDLWLADEEMAAAQAQLEQLGYQVKPDPTRTLAFQQRYQGELVLISLDEGRTSVELHWGAFVGEWIRRTADRRLHALCAHALAGSRVAASALWQRQPCASVSTLENGACWKALRRGAKSAMLWLVLIAWCARLDMGRR